MANRNTINAVPAFPIHPFIQFIPFIPSIHLLVIVNWLDGVSSLPSRLSAPAPYPGIIPGIIPGFWRDVLQDPSPIIPRYQLADEAFFRDLSSAW